MKDVYVVYWSSTGNTQAMAEAVGAGAESAGATAHVVEVASADASAPPSSEAPPPPGTGAFDASVSIHVPISCFSIIRLYPPAEIFRIAAFRSVYHTPPNF